MISFCVCYREKYIYCQRQLLQLYEMFQTINNDYKFCLQAAKLSHRQQVAAISLAQRHIQSLRADGKAEFGALIIDIKYERYHSWLQDLDRHQFNCTLEHYY